MMDYLLLAASGFIAWIVSTIGGGGGAMLLVPLIGFIAGAQAVAPVVAVATLIAGGGRILIFFGDIEWRVVGLFLISTIFQYGFGRRERTFAVATWWFFPAQFVVGFLSGLIGAIGPILNTLYLNAGITKEKMVGTKTAISLPMHLAKLGTYTALGALTGKLLLFGIAAGLGALLSNWLAKRVLTNMSELNFRAIVVGFMALSGAVMIWEQRETLLRIFPGST
ncbi:sulfite exporter TauE/SafE family protein [Sinorhizobium meliloti]|uniref:sulfite exporter TauE/SafE family protein n=1 Tax=Rhizobium meliloti TaxID=382 RepID=UPI000FDB37FA|nr:sulfite exporter TauE/SafE family protein [Sinorhizobium meliloti]RVI10715.1 sulfite exporter TauE/SafE family protein [Sinorhizobium meliloti]RVN38857.1 sulfite exporter TauE/SafE family protein [Sinorhizobium meliloti]RVQ25951.1 sulfite exporter TauE/SafE family protein [Sinorhizobium meliloti]RVQ35852.1 sulfite exporter TauE/SafE family protein [Sinorhizobium meliloti]RVQ63686.1 sulfite exporter TauE/SafE family protein [Sinorhizobium meliloti]